MTKCHGPAALPQYKSCNGGGSPGCRRSGGGGGAGAASVRELGSEAHSREEWTMALHDIEQGACKHTGQTPMSEDVSQRIDPSRDGGIKRDTV